MPGCERLELVSEGTYELEINAGVGPVKGSYKGTVKLEDLKPPSHYRMRVEANGKTGFLKGDGDVDLKAEGEGTLVSYNGSVQVGGPVAAVGQRMVQGAARMMTRQLFGAVSAEAVAAPGEDVKHGVVRDLVRGAKKP